jgi:hypothetical protein
MTIRRLNSAVQLAATGLMLTLWLAVVVLSISPALHQLLHHDSQSGKHECLVTHFIKNQVLSGASAGVVLMVDPVCVAASLPVDLTFVSPPEYRLSPSRAPPALFSSLKG